MSTAQPYGVIETRYGHTLALRPSSLASEPAAWLVTSRSTATDSREPLLTVDQARQLRDVLNAFIQAETP